MVNSTPYLRAITNYLRDTYGVRSFEVRPGGKHNKLVFEYGGKARRLTLAHERDNNRANLKRQDIHRMLGAPPTIPIITIKRGLDEMTTAVQARAAEPPSGPAPHAARTFSGRVALTVSPSKPDVSRLRVEIPPDLYATFGNVDRGVSIRRLDYDTFEVSPRPDRKRPRFTMSENGNYDCISEHAVPGPTPPEERFGVSPAECVLVDGNIMVRVLERRPIIVRSGRQPVLPKVEVGHSGIDPAAVLAALRRVEAETPYRLVRVKDDAGGHWAFQAPRIE